MTPEQHERDMATSKAKVGIITYGKTEWAAPENPDKDINLPLVVRWSSDEADAFAFFASDVDRLRKNYDNIHGEDPTYKFITAPEVKS